MQAPVVPIAIAVPTGVWEEFLATARDSRAKALLREGELPVPAIDAATVERTLFEAGAMGSGVAAVAANGADVALVESAIAVLRATAAPPTNQMEDDRARSAAERFLLEFLESLPETAGRFELNAALDFRFGSRRPRWTYSAAHRGSPLSSTGTSTFSHRAATVAIGQRTGSCSDGDLSYCDSWPKM